MILVILAVITGLVAATLHTLGRRKTDVVTALVSYPRLDGLRARGHQGPGIIIGPAHPAVAQPLLTEPGGVPVIHYQTTTITTYEELERDHHGDNSFPRERWVRHTDHSHGPEHTQPFQVDGVVVTSVGEWGRRQLLHSGAAPQPMPGGIAGPLLGGHANIHVNIGGFGPGRRILDVTQQVHGVQVGEHVSVFGTLDGHGRMTAKVATAQNPEDYLADTRKAAGRLQLWAKITAAAAAVLLVAGTLLTMM